MKFSLTYPRLKFPSFLFLFLLFTFYFLLFNCSAQPITFEKWYDYGFGESGNCVQQTTDGGYIIAGIQGITMGISKNLLIKTDSAGNVSWFKLFGGTQDNELWAIKQTTDGGYIMTGSKTGMQSNYYDISWIKTNSSGNTVWAKTLTTPPAGNPPQQVAYGRDILQTPDSGYVILANYYHDSSFNAAPMLIKTNMNGDTLWTKKYIYPYPGLVCHNIQKTVDGGFIIVGQRAVNTTPPINITTHLIKTNAAGDTLWTRSISDSLNEPGRNIEQLASGSYIIKRGRTYSNFTSDFLLTLTDSNGNPIWSKVYGGLGGQEGFGLAVTLSGEYLMSGFTDSNGTDIYLVKTDSNGNQQWQKTFGTPGGPDKGNFVRQTSDGGYIITGTRFIDSLGNVDAYLIKTDSAGNVITGIPQLTEYKAPLLIYPNPFANETILLLPKWLRAEKNKEMFITDIKGSRLHAQHIADGDNMAVIHRNGLATGIYFVHIISKNGIFASAKIIIQ